MPHAQTRLKDAQATRILQDRVIAAVIGIQAITPAGINAITGAGHTVAQAACVTGLPIRMDSFTVLLFSNNNNTRMDGGGCHIGIKGVGATAPNRTAGAAGQRHIHHSTGLLLKSPTAVDTAASGTGLVLRAQVVILVQANTHSSNAATATHGATAQGHDEFLSDKNAKRFLVRRTAKLIERRRQRMIHSGTNVYSV